MHLLDDGNLAAYLREQHRLPAGGVARIQTLSGGVSNAVFYVMVAGGSDFVVKQAREQLRVAQPWFCRVDRIWREVEVLRQCRQLLDQSSSSEREYRNDGAESHSRLSRLSASVPTILWEDRDNYCFAMSAAPADHQTWKQQLLAGQLEPQIAAACGRLLGRLHAGSWQSPVLATSLADRGLFDDLRLDPYYRTLAAAHPRFAEPLRELIDSVSQNLLALVHADFSPKNLLVSSGGLMMVDFETGHFGDPAFDLGFFLSHLFLKANYYAVTAPDLVDPLWNLMEEFWRSYQSCLAPRITAVEFAELQRRGVLHLAACAWARLDGKSPVEYLTDEPCRDRIRDFCQQQLSALSTNLAATGWNSFRAAARQHV